VATVARTIDTKHLPCGRRESALPACPTLRVSAQLLVIVLVGRRLASARIYREFWLCPFLVAVTST
jgi:hypothetical protein